MSESVKVRNSWIENDLTGFGVVNPLPEKLGVFVPSGSTKGKSKFINGFSIENVLCEEFNICAEARESFETFQRYCVGDPESCPNKILISDEACKLIYSKCDYQQSKEKCIRGSVDCPGYTILR